jgi:glycosyltransferase involved in cell wall biosynthesis
VIDVTHVITRMIVGGAQENTLFSVRGLAAIPRYRVSLVTGPETGSEGDLLEGREQGLDIVRVPHLVRSIHPASDAMALASLYNLFRRTRPSIVHTHSSKAGVLGRMAARAAGVPVVVHTLHSLVFHDYQHPAVRYTYRTIKRMMSPLTDHYVSVSDDIRERAIAARIGTPDRHSTVRSGFPTEDFINTLVDRSDARTRLGLPQDRVIVGVVARFFPLKGHEEIFEAARKLIPHHPDVLFAFAGSGPLLEEFRTRFADAGLTNNVHFLGRIPPEEVAVAFSSFDVMAHASLREGLARVIPQAVLAGLPVVCYDLDGSREVVHHGVNGFLVPPRDTDALADRLAAVVGDPGLRQRMGGQRRDVVLKEFSVEEMVRGLDELYLTLLERIPDSRFRHRRPDVLA